MQMIFEKITGSVSAQKGFIRKLTRLWDGSDTVQVGGTDKGKRRNMMWVDL